MEANAAGFEIRRNFLLDRLERVQPKIVAVSAPPGFGKSTLARQLLASKPNATVCDLADVADEADLGQRLIAALAAEPARPALEAWKDPVTDSIFVFENADHVARNEAALEFFSRVLSQRPDRRVVVICSRETLPLHLTRYAPPHEILTLRADDLAFDRSELLSLFGPYADRPGFLARIMQISQGWPIAVFLLRRFASEGRIDTLLENLADVAFKEIHDYLADEVLATLDPKLHEALFVCACIPHTSIADLQAAFAEEGAVHALVEFAKQSPFLTHTGEVFVLHPLLGALLVEHRQTQREVILARVAGAHSRAKHYLRAAELHLAHGDQESAAHALGQYEVIRDHTPSPEYARALASLDRALIEEYPRLWGITGMLRMFCMDMQELLEESESRWLTLSPTVTPTERSYLLIFRAVMRGYTGGIEEAIAMLEEYLRENHIGAQPKDYVEGYVVYVLGLLRARAGRLGQGERDMTAALPHVGVTDIVGSGALLSLGADIARARGEFAVARQFVDRALEGSRRSGLMNFVALDLAEACFGAWFAGDDGAFVKYGVELDEIVHTNAVRGLAYFAAAARGRHEEPTNIDMLKFIACGSIIAAANSNDARETVRYARAALAAAQKLGSPFVECLSAVAVATYDEPAFEETIAIAARAAARCESPALQSAVRAIAEGLADFGMLDKYMGRLHRDRFERALPLEVQLTAGVVRSAGREVPLSERELALLVALSLRRENVPRARLADLLWPELDEYSARNALSVCLHRLRAHLGSDRVVRSKDGYALHDDVRVDLWEIDRTMTALRSRTSLDDAERAQLSSVYEKLRNKRPERMLSWDWFEATERHLRGLRLEAAHRLAADALSNGNIRRALELAEEMIGYDPCDEAGRELAIKAHLRRDDRAAAMRQYRQYRETLLAELQCEPSEAIKQLVGLTQTRA
ncbi:MAG TPA: BTAD domain-containing putative transcriptional regulator [Candidatus Rubrimentiphilum sp.]|nr:BTAD domain-containing putative transcriptional regulator [Candidatus Rubrimentiphilum sp.]